MVDSESSSGFGSRVMILTGGLIALLLLNQAYRSLASGALQFSSVKYGFVFYGIEAAMIYAALLLGSILIVGIGWRGLRSNRGGP